MTELIKILNNGYLKEKDMNDIVGYELSPEMQSIVAICDNRINDYEENIDHSKYELIEEIKESIQMLFDRREIDDIEELINQYYDLLHPSYDFEDFFIIRIKLHFVRKFKDEKNIVRINFGSEEWGSCYFDFNKYIRIKYIQKREPEYSDFKQYINE